MTEVQIKKACFYYLIIGACIMVLVTFMIYVSYLAPYDFTKINAIITQNHVLQFLLAGSIIISFINIPLFAITGLILLFKRKRIGLAIFLWTATTAFIVVGRMVGDAW